LTANLLGWLTRFLSQAEADGELPAGTEPETAAASLLAGIQGALLLERTAGPGTAGRAIHFLLISFTGDEKPA
jgi:hypothetical protein